MATRTTPLFLLLLAPAAVAQKPTLQESAPSVEASVFEALDVIHEINGTVVDLTRDPFGGILFCTSERRVGHLVPGERGVTILAFGAAQFPDPPTALAVTPAGNLAVADSGGNIRVLAGGLPPAVLVWDNFQRYMVSNPTDLIVDGRGSFLLTSQTPSSGQRAINWISGDGQRWSYYLVRHQPIQLAHDPLTGGLLVSEATSGGTLQLVQPGSETRATTPIDNATHPGLSAFQSDGDVAVEADGDIYWIAGGEVWKRSRATNQTTLFRDGYDQLRGIVIAASHGWQFSPSGWSLYLAEGSNPTRIREIPDVGAPGDLIAADQGPVPNQGKPVNVTLGFQALELSADATGRLLLGGTQFGSTQYIKRVTLTGTPSIATVATSANGLAGPIEGLVVDDDASIWALSRTGHIQHVTEAPLTVTTVFSDPVNQITTGKDLVMDVDGSFYIACREAWDFGKILKVAGGVGTLLVSTEETRGLAANPLGGLFFSQWHNMGFNGTVDLFHFAGGGSVEGLPGFAGINYTNDFGWGDGDLCVDANGAIYSISEDDWSLVRYEPSLDGFVRIGSSYENHPSGLVIAPSTASSGSTTGWSLYASEFDLLWEKPSVQPPASTLVDSSLGFHVGRRLVGAPHPSFGKPAVLASAPDRGGLLIGTATGWVLALEPESGALRPIAGPPDGLRGELVALAPVNGGASLRALNRAGEVFDIVRGKARPISLAPERLAVLLERALEHPQRTLRAGRDAFALDGWAVWRTGSSTSDVSGRDATGSRE